jgi:uncharacterized protein
LVSLMNENLLGRETSPYLLQHKDNPVHWRPWGPQIFEEAQRLDKPILLSVGYSACHWCHVMAHESFENPEIAGLMNELFVNVKVDREERPDVDQIYMAGLQALGGRGGWPLTVFLTPKGDLFWGGSYFPPTARFGRAAFPDVLRQVEKAYRDAPERVAQNAARAMAAVAPTPGAGALTFDLVDAVAKTLLGELDPINGGLAGAPKFPQASLLEFLWRAADRPRGHAYEHSFLLAMTKICQGGVFDHLGGGFARYSTDERWLVPHFEKMLYDNAQLVQLLTAAWKMSGKPLFARRVAQTVEWLAREMRVEGGAFAASLDADSEGSEGRFYIWTAPEVEAVLDPQDAAFASAAFGVLPEGNWEGVNVLNRLESVEPDEDRLERARAKLFAARSARVAPRRDDKVLADWNGLAIEALCVAGAAFDRADWLDLARRAYRFVLDEMTQDGRVGHSARLGRVSRPGLSSDAACTIAAALALYEATAESSYLADAERLQASFDAYYFDDALGYALTASDARDLAQRPAGARDDATPNPNAVAARNLTRLGLFTGETRCLERAERLFQIFAGAAIKQPLWHLGLLNAFDFASRASEVVIVGATEAGEPLAHEVFSAKSPNLVLSRVASPQAPPPGSPAYGRPMIDGAPTAYLCRQGSCSLPLTSAAALREALASA